MLVLSFCMIAVANDMHIWIILVIIIIIIIGDCTVFIKLFPCSHACVMYVVCVCDYCVHNYLLVHVVY